MIAIHPAALEFPMMAKKRFEELREDIAANGLRVPVTLCDGMILDGRNRAKACDELGIKIKTDVFADDDPFAYVWSLNGTRRDLADEQRYLIWKHCNEKSEAWQAERQKMAEAANAKKSEAANTKPRAESGAFEKPSTRGTSSSPTGPKHPTRKAAAAASKTNPGAVARGDYLAKHAPELAAKVRRGEISMDKAIRQAKATAQEKEAEAGRQTVTEAKRRALSEVCEIRHCSCAELFESGIHADLVLTDPPYPEKFLPVFEELAIGCKLAQIPLVAVMAGQSYLPQILAAMTQYLKYLWTIAYLTPGAQSVQIWKGKVNTFWKPVLVFGTKTEWSGDVVRSDVNDNDKRFHNWGQSESGMARLVEMLSKPNQTICDPFLGGGATAFAALSLSRRFIGCDNDADSVKTSTARMEIL